MVEFESVEDYIDYLIEQCVEANRDREFALENDIKFIPVDTDCNSSDYSFDYCQSRKEDNDAVQLGYN